MLYRSVSSTELWYSLPTILHVPSCYSQAPLTIVCGTTLVLFLILQHHQLHHQLHHHYHHHLLNHHHHKVFEGEGAVTLKCPISFSVLSIAVLYSQAPLIFIDHSMWHSCSMLLHPCEGYIRFTSTEPEGL